MRLLSTKISQQLRITARWFSEGARDFCGTKGARSLALSFVDGASTWLTPFHGFFGEKIANEDTSKMTQKMD